MRLDVRLANHVHSVAIAQIIPQRAVRIVAGSNRIDVVLLHQFEVANHRLPGDNESALGQELVSIDHLDINGLSIDE